MIVMPVRAMQISVRNIPLFPMEMREAAKAMGVELLCESSMERSSGTCVKDIPNDRAVLRAMHFYEERPCCRCCEGC